MAKRDVIDLNRLLDTRGVAAPIWVVGATNLLGEHLNSRTRGARRRRRRGGGVAVPADSVLVASTEGNGFKHWTSSGYIHQSSCSDPLRAVYINLAIEKALAAELRAGDPKLLQKRAYLQRAMRSLDEADGLPDRSALQEKFMVAQTAAAASADASSNRLSSDEEGALWGAVERIHYLKHTASHVAQALGLEAPELLAGSLHMTLGEGEGDVGDPLEGLFRLSIQGGGEAFYTRASIGTPQGASSSLHALNELFATMSMLSIDGAIELAHGDEDLLTALRGFKEGGSTNLLDVYIEYNRTSGDKSPAEQAVLDYVTSFRGTCQHLLTHGSRRGDPSYPERPPMVEPLVDVVAVVDPSDKRGAVTKMQGVTREFLARRAAERETAAAEAALAAAAAQTSAAAAVEAPADDVDASDSGVVEEEKAYQDAVNSNKRADLADVLSKKNPNLKPNPNRLKGLEIAGWVSSAAVLGGGTALIVLSQVLGAAPLWAGILALGVGVAVLSLSAVATSYRHKTGLFSDKSRSARNRSGTLTPLSNQEDDTDFSSSQDSGPGSTPP